MQSDFYECGPGWFPIIEIFKTLVERDVSTGKMPPIEYQQIKEKFGGLRIYYSGGDKVTDAYCRFAEQVAAITCDECGAPASMRSLQGWYRTRCEEHIA